MDADKIIDALDGEFLVVSGNKFFDGKGFTDKLTTDVYVFDTEQSAKNAIAEIAKVYDGKLDVMQYRDSSTMGQPQPESRNLNEDGVQSKDATGELVAALQQVSAAYQQCQVATQYLNMAINTINALQGKATKNDVVIDRLGVETNADPSKVVKTMSAHLPELTRARAAFTQSINILTPAARMAAMVG